VPLDIPPSGSSWIADATGGLIAILDDPSPQVRGEAARALGRLRATIAVGRLQVLLADSDKFVRYEARQALDKIGGSE
jgi:HEAT repeat protein